MKVLIFGTDRTLFDKESSTSRRISEYASLVDELHVIVFSLRGSGESSGESKIKIAENMWVYPTYSRNKMFYGFDAIKIAKKVLKRNERWLVSSQDPFETGLVAWIMARAAGARLQLQIHTDFLSPQFSKGMIQKVRNIIARYLIPRADGIRVVSKRIKDSILERKMKLKSSIHVLPIYTDVQKVAQQQSEFDLKDRYTQSKFNIVMVGRLEEEKNYKLAIDAFAEVVKRYPNTTLVIIGDGSQKAILQKRVAHHGLGEHVVFVGYRNDVVSYYKTADLFLHTSNYEGYGLVLVEAAASGCPVVATDVGLIGEELNRDNVFLCEVGDADCIYKKIIMAMENKSLRVHMAIDAQKAVLAKAGNKEEYMKTYQKTWQDCM